MDLTTKVVQQRGGKALKVLSVLLLILLVMGVPERRADDPVTVQGRGEEREHAPSGEYLGGKNGQAVQGPISEVKEVGSRIKELALRAPVKLTEEEEYKLKISNYNAYIHYRARLEDPTLVNPMTKEEIIRERIAPLLLQQLAENRELSKSSDKKIP